MVIVHQLNKRLHTRLFRRLLRRILTDNLLRVFRDSGDQTVTVRTVASAVVELLDDDSLPAGETAAENHHCFVWF
ncbi:hypothetical protein HanIR_Chr08g0355541 [Helianthus annuus]|nr:hypothetical protein HanIR_Chr08g0355541 [Helianthus annuus]